MRKIFFFALGLMMTLCAQTVQAEVRIYAALSNSNKTLTLYYDDKEDTRSGVLNASWNDGRGTAVSDAWDKITSVVLDASMQSARPTSTENWFWYLPNLTKIEYLDYLNTSDVTNMSCMFDGCQKLTSVDVSHFNTTKVTDMSNMFSGCSKLTSLDLSGFNTEKVTDMSYMFSECTSLNTLDVSHFNVEKVTTMECMFDQCSNLTSLDLSSFRPIKVTTMYLMFRYCEKLKSLKLDNFDTGSVKNMSSMFLNCTSLASLDVSRFNTQNVTDMLCLFSGCSSLVTIDVSNFDMSKVERTYSMFGGCSSLTTIYCNSNWSTNTTLTSHDKMFSGCTSLVGGNGTKCDGINNLNVAYAHPDGGQSNPGYFTYRLPDEDEIYAVKESDNKTLTLYYDKQRPIRGGVTEWIVYADFFGEHITTVILDKSMQNARPTSMEGWFSGFESMKEIKNLNYLNTSEVTNMSTLFNDCKGLTSIDISSWDTRKVTDMSQMFSYCDNLKSINFQGVNTEQVKNMNYMFIESKALTSLDLTGFDTKNVEQVQAMFEGCSELTTIYCNEDWNTNTNLTSYLSHYNLFKDCSKLVGGNGTKYVASKVDKTYACPDDPDNGKPGYFTKKEPTGIDNQMVNGKCENAKILRDGQLFILRDGVLYNAHGARVE